MAEIRLREVTPDIIKKLETIQSDLKEKTATGAIEKLIADYQHTKTLIQSQRKTIFEYQRLITRYQQLEQTMSGNVRDYIDELERQIKYAKPLLKGLTASRKKSKSKK